MSRNVKSEKEESDRAWKQLQQTWKETNAGLADDLAKATETISRLEEQVDDLEKELESVKSQDANLKAALERKDEDMDVFKEMLPLAMTIVAIVRSTEGISFILDKDRNFSDCVQRFDEFVVRNREKIAEMYTNTDGSRKAVQNVIDSLERTTLDSDADDERERGDPDATPRASISSSKGKGKKGSNR